MKQHLIYIVLMSATFYSSMYGQKIVRNGATLQKVGSGYSFTEGPAAARDGKIYFTDQPNNQILVWEEGKAIEVFLAPAGRSNGMYFDAAGRLLSCADEQNQLWAIDSEGGVEVLVSDLDGQRLNGPNDLWVHPDGSVYFTDPFYKRPWWAHEVKPQPDERVYRWLPTMESPQPVADGFVRPNGIVGTADGEVLYIADIGDGRTYRYDIHADGTLQNRTLFCEMGSDGMTLDHKGNLYLTGDGVTVFNTHGEQIEKIDVPETWTANVVFGGKRERTLFMTARGSVYTLKMRVRGIRW